MIFLLRKSCPNSDVSFVSSLCDHYVMVKRCDHYSSERRAWAIRVEFMRQMLQARSGRQLCFILLQQYKRVISGSVV